MHSPEPAEDFEGPTVAVHRWMKVLATASVLSMHAVVVVSLWGRWTDIVLTTATIAVTVPFQLLLSHRFFLHRAHAAENLRAVIALVGTGFYAHFAGWLFPVWLLVMLNGLWADNASDRSTRVRVFGSLAALVALALVDGCPPEVALGMCLVCLMVFLLSGARMHVLRGTMERLSQRHEELTRALAELDLVHRRAREQERLSSLGMLAAGIAHEVNNPMSYVKSNLTSLHQEMLAEKEQLPPGLHEYVHEVLPETLQGVQRVCAIVADLRRFARGDPEALIEYDLNEEVRTALRITHGRVHAHCEVEVALEPLLPMLGHPRQMSQVVVNLLLNAAQSMKTRGKVYVATRPDGEDDVVLTVRDTGEGMSPEVMSHLFQPFFTTRAEGEGTGLGLAVVHGIVTSHGGRIRVESEPGQGSTFTVRLPRVPPMKFVSAGSLEDPSPSSSSSESSDPGRAGLH